MTVIVLAPAPGPASLALTAALTAGLGPVLAASDRVTALAALASHPRAALVLDLRGTDADQQREAARLRRQCPAVRTLALLADGAGAPPHCDAVFPAPVFLDDVVRWCARATVIPIAEGLLEDLAAGLCHEIGNPLTSLFLQLELLRSEKGGGASVDDHLAQIEEAARRIQGVVRDVAQAAERHPVRSAPTSLAALVEGCRALLGQRDPAFLARLTVDVEDLQLPLDRSLLSAALADLAEYLLRAGDPRDGLTIQAGPREAQGPAIRLSARVPRLPPDAAGRIFTPLWARQALGLPDGLSLTSARNAFLRHRGDVRARALVDGVLQLEAWLPAGDQATFPFPP